MNFGVMLDELSKDFVIHGEEDTKKKKKTIMTPEEKIQLIKEQMQIG